MNKKLEQIGNKLSELIIAKYGTSEGAMAAWDTRGRGRKSPEKKEPKPANTEAERQRILAARASEKKEPKPANTESPPGVSAKKWDLLINGIVQEVDFVTEGLDEITLTDIEDSIDEIISLFNSRWKEGKREKEGQALLANRAAAIQAARSIIESRGVKIKG